MLNDKLPERSYLHHVNQHTASLLQMYNS